MAKEKTTAVDAKATAKAAKANNGKTSYVTGKNYCKAENLDKIYETEENYNGVKGKGGIPQTIKTDRLRGD